MLEHHTIRDSYVALGQLVSCASDHGFGHRAADFLMTVSGASYAQYWEISALGDSFVLQGEARNGSSVPDVPLHSLAIRRNARSACPFDLLALSGKTVIAEANKGMDLSRLRSSSQFQDCHIWHLCPLHSAQGMLSGCVIMASGELELNPDSLETRIALQSIARLGEKHRSSIQANETIRELTRTVNRFDQARRSERKLSNEALIAALPGQSNGMRHLRSKLGIVAKSSNAAIVITDEGDSAEPVARELHRQGPDARAPFISVPANTLFGERFSLELFGHKRGVIPGVAGSRRGLLREANSGTVFIDRIDDLDASSQEQLLRLIRQKTFRPFGSSLDHGLAARLILSARQSSVPKDGRQSLLPALYFELKPTELVLPSLQLAPDDTKEILKSTLELRGLEPEQVERILNDHRLIKHLFSRAKHHSRDSFSALARAALDEAIIADELLAMPHFIEAERAPMAANGANDMVSLPDRVSEFETTQILEALSLCHGSRAEAAKMLSIPKRTLADKCRRYGL